MNIISSIIGPAIGGIIAVVAGYFFSKWSENEKENRRKQFLARVLLSELQKIQGFIKGIESKNIKSDNFLITRQPIMLGPVLTKDTRPEYDVDKWHELVHYIQNNDIIRVTDTAPLVSNKNPFEVFASEIYSFEDNDLIRDLFKVDRLLNEANNCLNDFFKFKTWNGPDGQSELFFFMRKIERVKPEIEKILSDGKLESLSKIQNKNLNINLSQNKRMVKDLLKNISIILFWGLIVVSVSIPIGIFLNFGNTMNITTLKELVQNLDNSCITIATITLAVIFAIITIFITKQDSEKKDSEKIDGFMIMAALTILTIIFSLSSQYYSYLNLSIATYLCALSVMLTILILDVLFAKFYFRKGDSLK
jgi:hypothetical protein